MWTNERTNKKKTNRILLNLLQSYRFRHRYGALNIWGADWAFYIRSHHNDGYSTFKNDLKLEARNPSSLFALSFSFFIFLFFWFYRCRLSLVSCVHVIFSLYHTRHHQHRNERKKQNKDNNNNKLQFIYVDDNFRFIIVRLRLTSLSFHFVFLFHFQRMQKKWCTINNNDVEIDTKNPERKVNENRCNAIGKEEKSKMKTTIDLKNWNSAVNGEHEAIALTKLLIFRNCLFFNTQINRCVVHFSFTVCKMLLLLCAVASFLIFVCLFIS